jgi:hypothetical protein
VATWLGTIGYQQWKNLLFEIHRIRIAWYTTARPIAVAIAIAVSIIYDYWLRDFMFAAITKKKTVNGYPKYMLGFIFIKNRIFTSNIRTFTHFFYY